MNFNRVLSWSTIAACVVCFACGDDDGKQAQPAERSTILNLAASQIAAIALSDTPNQDFVVARTRVQERVPAARSTYARQFAIGAGRGAAVASDPEITASRRLAATALGTTLDPSKEVDTVTAQASIDALLAEVQKITPAASSCDALPSGKAEACAIAFLILEVRRSEGAVLTVPDAGTPGDAGSDAGTSVPTGAIVCGARDITGAREVTGTITASDTWSGKLLIKGRVLVTQGAKITIAAGTQIFMDVDSSLEIGWNSSDASVFADGTAAAPIKFCGKTADKGFWESLLVGINVTSDSYLRNVLVAEGGGTKPALQLEADILIDNVQVADSGKDGVSAGDFKAGSQFLSVRSSGGYPLIFETAGALSRVPLGGTFTGNMVDAAVLRFGTIEEDVTVHDLAVPYLQELRLLQSKGTLLIEAGVEWRVKSDVTLELGWNSNATSVQAMGTAANPVLFRSVDDISNWGGLLIGTNVATSSKIAYTEIQGAGKARTSALEVDAAITLDHVTLRKNLAGVQIADVGLAAGSALLTVTETQGTPLSVARNGVFSLPLDSVLTGNMSDRIELTGGGWDKTGIVSDLGIPYHVKEPRWLVSNNAAITFKRGTEFVFGSNVEFNLAWNASASTITAVGTADAPIRFYGEQDIAGFWQGIVLDSPLPNSSFDYIEVANAGLGGTAALSTDVNVPITNSKFIKSAGFGISKATSIATDYNLGGNTFMECTSGSVGTH